LFLGGDGRIGRLSNETLARTSAVAAAAELQQGTARVGHRDCQNGCAGGHMAAGSFCCFAAVGRLAALAATTTTAASAAVVVASRNQTCSLARRSPVLAEGEALRVTTSG